MKEGTAVQDFRKPERIVIGADNLEAAEKIKELYMSGRVRIRHPVIITTLETAELAKYACNAMLATRISFMNNFSNLSDKIGADIKVISKIMALDSRIGERFLQAGAGYGGSCFPKDIRAVKKMMEKHSVNYGLLDQVDYINQQQKTIPFYHIKNMVGNLDGKIITLLGLSFKPKTTDMREASSLTIVSNLQKEKAIVNAYDPMANNEAMKLMPTINYFDNVYDAIK